MVGHLGSKKNQSIVTLLLLFLLEIIGEFKIVWPLGFHDFVFNLLLSRGVESGGSFISRFTFQLDAQ